MSFLTVLEKIGSDIVSIFKKAAPVLGELQAIATPFENIYAPGLSQAINIAITQIYNAEALAAAAGSQDGTGATKLAAVIAALAPQIAPTLASMGVTNPTTEEYTNFINALVAAANAFKITQTTPVVVTSPVATVAPVTGAAVPPK